MVEGTRDFSPLENKTSPLLAKPAVCMGAQPAALGAKEGRAVSQVVGYRKASRADSRRATVLAVGVPCAGLGLTLRAISPNAWTEC